MTQNSGGHPKAPVQIWVCHPHEPMPWYLASSEMAPEYGEAAIMGAAPGLRPQSFFLWVRPRINGKRQVHSNRVKHPSKCWSGSASLASDLPPEISFYIHSTCYPGSLNNRQPVRSQVFYGFFRSKRRPARPNGVPVPGSPAGRSVGHRSPSSPAPPPTPTHPDRCSPAERAWTRPGPQALERERFRFQGWKTVGNTPWF